VSQMFDCVNDDEQDGVGTKKGVLCCENTAAQEKKKLRLRAAGESSSRICREGGKERPNLFGKKPGRPGWAYIKLPRKAPGPLTALPRGKGRKNVLAEEKKEMTKSEASGKVTKFLSRRTCSIAKGNH